MLENVAPLVTTMLGVGAADRRRSPGERADAAGPDRRHGPDRRAGRRPDRRARGLDRRPRNARRGDRHRADRVRRAPSPMRPTWSGGTRNDRHHHRLHVDRRVAVRAAGRHRRAAHAGRVHADAGVDESVTLGLGCLLVGAALQLGDFGSFIRLVSIGAFILLTTPVVGARHRARGIPGRGAALGGHRARRAERQCRSPVGERHLASTADDPVAIRHDGFGYAESVTTDEIRTAAGAALDWLERIAGDWRLLDSLPIHERQRLHRVIAALSTADPAANRKRRKAARADECGRRKRS